MTSTMQSAEPGTSERCETPEANPAGTGGVPAGAVLDIGGDTGALVIYADEHTVGSEIEICPKGDISKREHNVVRVRRTPNGPVYAAVFPSLLHGEYSVLTDDLQPSVELSVIGGRVTEIDCSTGQGS